MKLTIKTIKGDREIEATEILPYLYIHKPVDNSKKGTWVVSHKSGLRVLSASYGTKKTIMDIVKRELGSLDWEKPEDKHKSMVNELVRSRFNVWR